MRALKLPYLEGNVDIPSGPAYHHSRNPEDEMAEMSSKQMVDTCLAACDDFKGLITELESAIGTFIVGKKFGWRVLYLAHNKATIEKYERRLGVKFREVLPEEGPLVHKSLAWAAFKKIGNFWKAVKGEIPGIRSAEIGE